MSLELLSQALERELGFASAAVGERQLARAADSRAVQLGLSLADYAIQANADSRELVALLAALNIDESWLWRDPAQLESLREQVRRRDQSAALRVLCAPCARGEEVWSLAALLFELGWRAPECRIVGVELAEAALLKAERGCYPRSAWREAGELPWWLRDVPDQQVQVDPQLRPLVQFECANLLHWSSRGAPGFDVLFSRNFLIYLGAEARQRWLQRLLELAAPGASFWTARSESLALYDARFRLCGDGAFERSTAPSESHAAPPVAMRSATRKAPAVAVARIEAPTAVPPAAWMSAAVVPTDDTRERLDRALAALQADDLTVAEALLREVLYLHHDCEEAVLHLAALRVRLGDPEEARRLHARLGRARDAAA